MPDTMYGYRRGPRNEIQARLDSTTSTVNVGDMLTLATAGYYKQASAGDVVHGVATSYSTAPSTDGEKSVTMDISPDALYAYPPDSGTVTVALIGLTCDVGGAQSVAIAASTDDCLLIRDVDVASNLVYVQIRPAFAGVI